MRVAFVIALVGCVSANNFMPDDGTAVQCPGQDAASYCDCEGDCGSAFCQCDEALSCCIGKTGDSGDDDDGDDDDANQFQLGDDDQAMAQFMELMQGYGGSFSAAGDDDDATELQLGDDDQAMAQFMELMQGFGGGSFGGGSFSFTEADDDDDDDDAFDLQQRARQQATAPSADPAADDWEPALLGMGFGALAIVAVLVHRRRRQQSAQLPLLPGVVKGAAGTTPLAAGV